MQARERERLGFQKSGVRLHEQHCRHTKKQLQMFFKKDNLHSNCPKQTA
jgi:hypothetical protein